MGIIGAELENFTIDQFAGSLALVLGSIGGLLMIIWKSRCHCKFNLCYVCQCERKPPPDEKDSEGEEGEGSNNPVPPSRPADTEPNP
jgi:hypothetical protein